MIFLQLDCVVFESQCYEYHSGTHNTQQMEHKCREMGAKGAVDGYSAAEREPGDDRKLQRKHRCF